jgi:hypothetical protein
MSSVTTKTYSRITPHTYHKYHQAPAHHLMVAWVELINEELRVD